MIAIAKLYHKNYSQIAIERLILYFFYKHKRFRSNRKLHTYCTFKVNSFYSRIHTEECIQLNLFVSLVASDWSYTRSFQVAHPILIVYISTRTSISTAVFWPIVLQNAHAILNLNCNEFNMLCFLLILF